MGETRRKVTRPTESRILERCLYVAGLVAYNMSSQGKKKLVNVSVKKSKDPPVNRFSL